jgi:hypothetical protein
VFYVTIVKPCTQPFRIILATSILVSALLASLKKKLVQTNNISRGEEVKRLLTERRERQVSAENIEKLELSRRTFTFRHQEDACSIQFALNQENGCLVVRRVNRERKELASFILRKYSVVSATAAGAEVELTLDGIRDALAMASPTAPVAITFSKPLPKMPLHGFARKRLATNSRSVMPKEVVNWLESFCDAYEQRGSSPRAHTLRNEMLKVGGPLYLCKDGSRFVQDEGRLFGWLRKRFSEQKSAGINLAVYAAQARAARLQNSGAGAGTGVVVNGDADANSVGDDDSDEPDYSDMNISQLKQELRARGLRLGGTKAELIQRLRGADAQSTEVTGDNSESSDDTSGSDD